MPQQQNHQQDAPFGFKSEGIIASFFEERIIFPSI